MNYQVLARKWRPHNFSEVVGQMHVVKALTNALQHDRLHHAYLFTGTRGVGKTTLARILAKAINCENLNSFNPCGTCAICREIDEGRFLDLIEVDAASRTKVEDTRDLLDNVQYAPNRGRYKVYLIDEVHMLSGHSFNALLKTLEEPPPHVKFLLATTDPQKIPVTVLSRCLQFNLKQLLPEQIFQQMAFILAQEKIEFDNSALKLLARAADGSMRDGLSLLDQAIVYGNGRVQVDEVHTMLGTIAQQPVDVLLNALADGDPLAIFDKINDIADLTADFADVLRQMLYTLHQIAVVQQIPNLHNQDLTADNLNALAAKFTPEAVQLYYQIALMGQKDLVLAPDARSGFEMVLLRMLAFKPVDVEMPKIEQSTRSVNSLMSQQSPIKPSIYPQTLDEVLSVQEPAFNQPVLSEKNYKPVESTLTLMPQISDDWARMIVDMRLNGLTKELASNCVLESLNADVCTLLIDPKAAHIRNAKIEELLQKALQTYRGKALKLVIKAQNTAMLTPAIQAVKERENRQQAAVDAINSDGNILALKEQLGAQVVPGSIEPR